MSENDIYTVFYSRPIGSGYIFTFEYVEKKKEEKWNNKLAYYYIDTSAVQYIAKGKVDFLDKYYDE